MENTVAESGARIIISQLIFNLAPMLQKNFLNFSPHLQSCRILIDSTKNSITTLGSDDIICINDTIINHSHCLELRNPEKLDITAFALHPNINNFFAIGSSNGFVKFLKPINQLQLQKADIIYKGDKPIRNLRFSQSGKLLAISTDQQQCIIYCLKTKKLSKLPNPHGGFVNSAYFSKDSLIGSVGSQGNMHIYRISMNEPNQNVEDEDQSEDLFAESAIEINYQFIDKYRIVSEAITRMYPYINIVFANFITDGVETTSILASGQTSLQVIDITSFQSSYRLQRGILEEKEILLICVLNKGGNNKAKSIVTVTVDILSIWNYSKHQKLLQIKIVDFCSSPITSLISLKSQTISSFAFINNHQQSNGKIYLFNNHALLDVEQSVATTVEELPMEVEKIEKKVQKKQPKNYGSIASKLIPEYPQELLEKYFEEYQNARFLFYNNIGCVIERTQSDDNRVIELELHDRSRANRMGIKAKNRKFQMFDLREKVFLIASSTLMVFQEEKQLRQGNQGWQVRWQNIQAISIGGTWVAAANNEEIKIFDYTGNQLHTISFDRKIVAMEAYEDMLAVVFHSGFPMWDCQSLKMRIYKVNEFIFQNEKDVMLSMNSNSRLKWFGFSEEGMIYCQDSCQVLRCYISSKNEWHTVYSLDGKPEKLFIQHIEGADVYGFKIQQRAGEREEPKVLPRSLPRKIPLQIPDLKITFLNRDEQQYLKKIILKNLQITHEEIRRELWYKHKYSRKRQHPWFNYSKSIKSQQEIKTIKMQIDIQLYDYVKKFMERIDNKPEKTSYVIQSLLLICDRESHLEETKQQIKEILLKKNKMLLPSYFEDISYRIPKTSSNCKTKLNQINILEQMLTMMEKIY